jgi:ribA/ribD-fused uncharacterized protein
MANKVIDIFDGPYRFLSNFAFSPIVVRMEYFPGYYRKVAFSTVEHAYQANKMVKFSDVEKIQAIEPPNEAKKLARSLPLRKNWDTIRIPTMTRLIDLKFPFYADMYRENSYLPIMTDKLLDTEDCRLIEGNWWNDIFWGKCNGEGENHLGKILMARREKIKEFIDKVARNPRKQVA